MIQEESYAQKNSRKFPSTEKFPEPWPCWLICSALLELQVNGIQRHKLLKMKTKLLVAGVPTACSDVHGVFTSFFLLWYWKVAFQVRADSQ